MVLRGLCSSLRFELTMLKQLVTQVKATAEASHVDHRDGAGHLAPAYEAYLRARARDRARNNRERAFVSRTWPSDRGAGHAGGEFVTTLTRGEYDPFADDEERSGERGGPFVETSADVEFAYGTDASNPAGATREPFPTS
jgi:hypothetical protein